MDESHPDEIPETGKEIKMCFFWGVVEGGTKDVFEDCSYSKWFLSFPLSFSAAPTPRSPPYPTVSAPGCCICICHAYAMHMLHAKNPLNVNTLCSLTLVDRTWPKKPYNKSRMSTWLITRAFLSSRLALQSLQILALSELRG